MSDDGEDSLPRPKRKIKKVMVLSSASSSDSDDSGPTTSTRKKRLRVLSEDDSESSDSVIVREPRRSRTLPKLRDSDADSDTSGWATDHSDKPSMSTSQTNKPTSGFASDSSEGNSDKCSICLMRFTDQQVGTPQNCEHIFCLDCITEWSRNVNTCPVDRITFDSIVVRRCAGGRVLRTEPVKVLERTPSHELLVVEDPTPCEICGSTSNEDTMLLCDSCDLGYHMECLTPPLTEIPIDQWLCQNCDDLFDVIHLSEVNELFSNIGDVDLDALGPRPRLGRHSSNMRASLVQLTSGGGEGPSTSAEWRGAGAGGSERSARPAPSSRRGSSRPAAAPRRRRSGGSSRPATSAAIYRPRRRKRTMRKTKTVVIEYEVQENGKFPVTKTIKRRVKKRKSRKAARTAARRTQVRAGVRAQLARLAAGGGAAPAHAAPASLAAARLRAGIPALSVFGSAYDLDYFSDEERAATGGAAVAARPAASARLDHVRQMRRKIVSVPSPPPAASAPDLLSSILESQTLLHSRRAVATISVDGAVDIQLPETKTSKPTEPRPRAEEATSERVDVRKGAGVAGRQAPAYPGQGRGGGWGGGYRGTYRRDQTSPAYGRQYEPGAPRPHPPPFRAQQQRHDDGDRYYPPPRRAPPFPPPDDPYFERRRSDGPRPRPPAPPRPRLDAPHHRHSYGGGFENPLDMRVGPPVAPAPPPQYVPMREPPAFDFGAQPAAAEPDRRSEDDRSDPDPDLVIDTEKYDPTEPTNDDDDSGEEATSVPAAEPPAPAAPAPPPAPPVGASVLDSAVRAVLHEHRLLAAPAPARDASDDEEDGDCPNFSIYSATSVHIANHSATLGPLPSPPPAPKLPGEDLSDLVQEDASPPPAPLPAAPPLDEYSERVSKRCPITTNPRTPIKIKLNAPSLIKRQMSLYDEEEVAVEATPASAPDVEDAPITEGQTREDDDRRPSESPAPIAPRPSDGDALENGTPPREEENESPPDEPAVVDRADEPEEGDEKEDEKKDREESGSASGDHTDDEGGAGSPRPLEKMTESISETEDERSYTPCLDEHREASAEPIAGLDTELISEDEGQGVFSEEEAPPAPPSPPPPAAQPAAPERDRKKKKKEAKREGRDRKGKAKRDVAFKKLSKSGKERNYRERDKKRRASSESRGTARRRRDKRQDLERYDVRSVVSDKRRRHKDAFGRDVSPPPSASPPPRRPTASPRRRPSMSPRRRFSISPRRRPSVSPRRRPSVSPRRRPSPSPRRRPTISPRRRPTVSPRRRPSMSPRRRPSMSPRRRLSMSPRKRPSMSPRRRPSISPRRRLSISPRRRQSASPRRISPRRRMSPSPRRKMSLSPRRRVSPSPARSAGGSPGGSPARRRRGSAARPKRRRRSTSRARKRRRSASADGSPKPKSKKKKGARRRSPRRRRRGSASPPPLSPQWVERPASPRTPPAPLPAPDPPHRLDRLKHRRQRELPGPSKEVFTSGDNILVSVSFKEQEEERRGERRGAGAGRRRRRRHQPDLVPADAKPVAIIDLDRSPFRELTPSPKNVIVLSDDEGRDPPPPAAPPAAAAAPDPPQPAAPAAPAPPPTGPKTPPSPGAAGAGGAAPGAPADTPPQPPDSPDAYDPYEPTRSASPPAAAASPPRAPITLEAAQKTNMSADEVIDRRPLSPMEKVLALLASTRDVSPEPPPPPSQPAAAASPPPHAAPPAPPAPPALRNPPKLFLAKPSPIKSDPIKPMQQATKISRLPLPLSGGSAGGESPYSPGSSDFGELFSPHDAFDAIFDKPRHPTRKRPSAKVTPKPKPKKGAADAKDDDSLKVLEELPSSAVEMQLKTKFLKKLNRQERVVEEVKLVLKPHYNRKRLSKDEYKHILRRAVPKICHNKSGEINPTKIQALVEAYVKKFRKKRKLGLP